tara:strand:- start:3781 stop:4239 length:459 start_codon:yes stop_codon:yes gene_type:complete
MHRKNEKFKQGVYKPLGNKYKGKSYPKYRSSWELKFFRWCDLNQNIIEWNSENVIIPYRIGGTGKPRRYIVDNTVSLKKGNKIIKYLVEIKPYAQTQPPKPHGNKKRSTIIYEQYSYAKNISKWKAAKQWCKKNGYEFLILTEKELFNKRIN